MNRINQRRFTVLGDSISLHYSPYLPDRLDPSIVLVRPGESGEADNDLDTPQGGNRGESSRLRAWAERADARGEPAVDLVLFNAGLHDVKRDPASDAIQTPLPVYRRNLEALALLLPRAERPAAWVRTTPCDDEQHRRHCSAFYRRAADVAYNAAADAIMAAHGLPIIDLHGFTLGLPGELYCDHVHFHDRVREAQAEFLAEWVGRLLNPPDAPNLPQPGPNAQ